MDDQRKTPEEVLAKIKEEEAQQGKGRLKIFLGAAPGVGKTYQMLEAAQKLLEDGVDVVAGLVVTHGRKETEELLEGLETIPEAVIEYKGAKLRELDLDEVLLRKPSVALVDELAHTNAPGCRHEKRWQDVQEILQAGINVFTTINIQHLESVNDLVAQITGVKVQETVPDSVFEQAYEVEVVDLPPDELIQRLREGKVYVADFAKTALENFFRKGNLIALRELALRMTAERVDAQMLKYREDSTVREVWPVSERILVCVGPSPLSARLVRATKRMAASMRAEWMAVYVETPASARMSEKDKNRVVRNLQTAQRLGAEATRISGTNTTEELVKYAQRRNVSKIVIGKPAKPRWRELLFGSIVDDLIRRSGNIDVYVITGDNQPQEVSRAEEFDAHLNLSNYLRVLVVVAIATGLSKLLFPHLAAVNLAMIYLLGVVVIAIRYGKGPSILAAILSVAVFDFFFIPPYLSFAVSDAQYIFTFMVMLFVGLTLSTLTSTVKLQAELARKRERQTAALYAMTREQASATGTREVVRISARHVAEVFDCKVTVLLHLGDQLAVVPGNWPTFGFDSKEYGVAQWVYINQQPAGATTQTLVGAKALYLPLRGTTGSVGVIGVLPSSTMRLSNPDEMHLFETFVNQMALAVERAMLTENSKSTRTVNADA